MPRQIVSKWRQRFFIQRMPGLDDPPRGGRQPAFPLVRSFLAIRTSPARPGGSSICTSAAGKVQRWGPRDYVLCIDEKTSIQARRRKHR